MLQLVTYLLPTQFTLITATIFAAVHQFGLSNGIQVRQVKGAVKPRIPWVKN